MITLNLMLFESFFERFFENMGLVSFFFLIFAVGID